MTDRQKQWLLRILLGGGAGVLPALALWGPLFAGGYSAPPVCRGLMDVLGLPGGRRSPWGCASASGRRWGGHAAFRDGRKNARPGPNCQGRAYRRSRRHLASRPGGAAHFAGYQHIPGN